MSDETEAERYLRVFCRLAGIRVETTALEAITQYLLRPSCLAKSLRPRE